MTYYLGRAGALVALPDPEVGLSQTPERIGGTHQLLSGARVRDTLGQMRTWNLSWTAIDLTMFGTLQAFFYGLNGAGPFYFLDPEQRNLLTANVSSGTSVTSDTTGFTIGTASSIFTTANAANNFSGLGGPFPAGSLVTLGATVPNGYVALSTLYSLTSTVQVVPGVSYAFSAYLAPQVMPGGIYIQINWQTAAGAAVSNVASNTIASTAVGRAVAVGVAPATATQAKFTVQGTANNTGSGADVYADGFQFEQATTVSAWVPGPGQPKVTVESLTRSTPLAGVCDAQMTLVQVG